MSDNELDSSFRLPINAAVEAGKQLLATCPLRKKQVLVQLIADINTAFTKAAGDLADRSGSTVL